MPGLTLVIATAVLLVGFGVPQVPSAEAQPSPETFPIPIAQATPYEASLEALLLRTAR